MCKGKSRLWWDSNPQPLNVFIWTWLEVQRAVHCATEPCSSLKATTLQRHTYCMMHLPKGKKKSGFIYPSKCPQHPNEELDGLWCTFANRKLIQLFLLASNLCTKMSLKFLLTERKCWCWCFLYFCDLFLPLAAANANSLANEDDVHQLLRSYCCSSLKDEHYCSHITLLTEAF